MRALVEYPLVSPLLLTVKRYERPPMEIWSAAKDVLAYNGTLYGEDVMKSTLEASVNRRDVTGGTSPKQVVKQIKRIKKLLGI